MPAKALPLPEWLPDQPGGGLSIASNVYPIASGYAPVGSPQAITVALDNPFAGGGSFIDSTGASTLIVVDTAGNYLRYTGSAWEIFTTGTPGQTSRFAQFGDNLCLINGGVVSVWDLLTQSGEVVTDAPDLIDGAQARDFVMGITTDNALQWCQFNNCLVWTTGSNQADKQPSLWGQLKRVIGGEYVIAITDRAIVRGTYVGSANDIIWQFDEISQEVGCMAEGSVCNVGRLIFFLSERGFMMCDGNEVSSIADEKFNRWFFDTYSRADIANIWAAIDPRRSLALWAMPGTPGRIIAYNWVLKRATTIETDVSGMMAGFTASVSLDDLDAIYGDLDSIPVSLDDASLSGGNPILMIADGVNVLNSLTGSSLEAKLRLENVEPSPGKRSRIRGLRPVTDAVSASATIDARMRAGDAESIRSAGSMRSNGKLPIRSNGRYNDIELTIPAGESWSYIQALEIEFEQGDGR